MFVLLFCTGNCAASVRVCHTYACAASRRVSVLWQPVMYLDVSGWQQPYRPWTWLFYSSLCCPCSIVETCLFYGSLCYPWTCLCVCSSVQQSVLSQEVSGLQQQFVLHLDVSVRQQPVLCQEVYGPQYSSLCCTWSIRLQEILCCTWTCLSTTACAALERVCLQELLCCTWTCLSTKALRSPGLGCLQQPVVYCTAPVRVFLQDPIQCWIPAGAGILYKKIWFVSKRLCLFRLFRYMFETPKQTKKKLVSGNKLRNNANRLSFGKKKNPKIFFVGFEDPLSILPARYA